MSDLDALVARILADPLAPARAAPRAIGYVGTGMPEDLLAATGAHCLHLPWTAGRPTPRADRWMEATFMPWAASILEDWSDGRFDFLDHVLFSRADDSAQRLYYYLTELQRRELIGGPVPLIMDVALIPRPSSLARTIESLRGVATRLGVDDGALRNGIAVANARRGVMTAIDSSRAGPGSRYERIARASLFAPLTADATGVDTAGKRVLLAGTPPPDDRLHRAIEAAGANVVGEAHERNLLRLGAPIEATDDPFAAVARSILAARFGARGFADPAAELVAEARRVRAEAVVLWLVEQEESIGWHLPAQRAALETAGLPVLVLTRRRWDAADGAAEEIATFIGSLKS